MLTPEQEQTFRDHLRAIGARETCPICDAGRWILQIRGFELVRTCAQCGLCLTFDSKVFGWEVRSRFEPTRPGYQRRIDYLVPIDEASDLAVALRTQALLVGGAT